MLLTTLFAAAWIAYPGDYGIWWGNEVQANRLQHGGNELVTWPQHEPHSRVIFSKELTLEKPETVRIYADGRFRVGCTAFKPDWAYSAPTNAYVIPAGTSKLSVKVYNPARPPAILIEGASVFTGPGWTACWDFAEEVPAETLEGFDDPRTPPGLAAFRARAAKLRRDVKPLFWNEERGGLGHLLKEDGTIDEQFTRYPNIFGLFYGYFNDVEKERVVRDVLLNDRVMSIQTPYMRFCELEALCRIGRQSEVLDEIRSYWGGMLDFGATVFWELYNPEEKGLQHYAMYGRPFGKTMEAE